MQKTLKSKEPHNSRTVLSPLVIKKFCDLCRDAQGYWKLYRTLYDDNSEFSKMGRSKCIDFLLRLKPILSEYSLHQIVKLHDPAIQQGSLNLTFDLIVQYGGWDSKTTKKLSKLQDELESLLPVKDKGKGLGAARNKILSHNDLKTILDDFPLGGFPEGNDSRYFVKVKEFLDLVREKWAGGHILSNNSVKPYKEDDLSGPFIFDDFVDFDVSNFLAVIRKNDSKSNKGVD